MLLPEVDLLVEHAGHKLQLTGSGPEYSACFPTLSSALHFFLNLRHLRKHAPKGLAISIEWRRFKFRVRT